jgi:hypothetical protein
MPPHVQSQPWPGDSALLLVHGVGSYHRADYDSLIAALKAALGDARWSSLAVYTALYDEVNDWFAEKVQAGALIQQLVGRLRGRFNSATLGDAAAEGAGDVVWPVLSLDARMALRELILAQIGQMVLDGDAAVPFRRMQKLYIVCHSLGCFHTYEALHAAATDPAHALQPVSDNVHFRAVVMMASPVKLIRTVAEDIPLLVPSPGGLASLGPGGLTLPGQQRGAGDFDGIAKRFISLTGNLDPVGGYLFRQALSWAYMNVPGQQSIVEDQQVLGLDTRMKLEDALREAAARPGGLSLSPRNPHNWTGYVSRNAAKVAEWLS